MCLLSIKVEVYTGANGKRGVERRFGRKTNITRWVKRQNSICILILPSLLIVNEWTVCMRNVKYDTCHKYTLSHKHAFALFYLSCSTTLTGSQKYKHARKWQRCWLNFIINICIWWNLNKMTKWNSTNLRHMKCFWK